MVSRNRLNKRHRGEPKGGNIFKLFFWSEHFLTPLSKAVGKGTLYGTRLTV